MQTYDKIRSPEETKTAMKPRKIVAIAKIPVKRMIPIWNNQWGSYERFLSTGYSCVHRENGPTQLTKKSFLFRGWSRNDALALSFPFWIDRTQPAACLRERPTFTASGLLGKLDCFASCSYWLRVTEATLFATAAAKTAIRRINIIIKKNSSSLLMDFYWLKVVRQNVQSIIGHSIVHIFPGGQVPHLGGKTAQCGSDAWNRRENHEIRIQYPLLSLSCSPLYSFTQMVLGIVPGTSQQQR